MSIPRTPSTTAFATIGTLATLTGSEGDDLLAGGLFNDVLEGLGGDDDLVGYEGNDDLYGDAGNDNLDGGAGADWLDGGDGVDLADYYYAPWAVTVDLELGEASGGDGNDTLTGIEDVSGSAWDDDLYGDAIANWLYGDDGDDLLDGGDGNDTLEGGYGDDILHGGNGYDEADYFYAPDAVSVDLYLGRATGGAGNDTLTGIEDVVGSAFGDTIYGDAAGNRFDGDDGDDVLMGYGGADTLLGGYDYDTLTGGDGNDDLDGESGNDILRGGNGLDVLLGGRGNDVLMGGAGADTLQGGSGKDKLAGGAGADRFVFASAPASGLDTITDFLSGRDRIALDTHVFAALDPGALLADQFVQGAGVHAAQDLNDRIAYDTSSGLLYYDADGAGGASAVAFARVGAVVHPVLAHTDFTLLG